MEQRLRHRGKREREKKTGLECTVGRVERAVSYLSSKVSSPVSQLPAATLDLPVAMAHGAIFSIAPTL